MKGKVLSVIKTQEPYEDDQLEVPEPGQVVAELTEEAEEDDGASAGENQEQPHLQQEEVKEMHKTEGTPIIEKTKIASVEMDAEEEQFQN